ncbi:MAG: GNAT family N-acetyltransferase, partial [Eubacteriales bacterium]|nr:GNAT family N-acetyltransferase [Eubacteriales bacterium]
KFQLEGKMTERQFDEIKNRLMRFPFTSLKYTFYEEISDYEVLFSDDKSIILYGYDPEGKRYQYHWACNHKEDLLSRLQRKNDSEYITFIPKGWVESLKSIGFNVFAIWNDYFADSLENYAYYEEPGFINSSNFKEAAEVTRSCAGQSRGFTGQSDEWMKQWINNTMPASPDYTSNCAAIAEISQEVAGVVCVATYASNDKTILWLRDIAVKPEFQGKGIARKLVGQAYAYGLKHGAVKAFLMADECNDIALHLYKSMGFKAGSDEGQIDMIRL